MSIFKDKKFSGQFPGNYAGNLWQTFNIDLEKYPGRISLSGKMRRESSGLGRVVKFIRTNADATDQWYGIVNDSTSNIIKNGSTSPSGVGTWADDSSASSPTDPLDAEIHESANGEQRLVVTRATDVAILNRTGAANAWTASWWVTTLGKTALTSLSYHPIARLQRLLAIGDKVLGTSTNVPVIHTIDKDDVVVTSALTFPAEFTVKNIYSSSNRFWIGLMNNSGGNARVIEWDGTSTTYNNEYNLVGSIPLCGFIVRDIPYFITERGIIFKYTGGGFEEIQNFGFFKEQRIAFAEGDLTNYGATVDGDLVYLNVNIPVLQSGSDATAVTKGVRRGRSGVWIFDTKKLNLYHHAGFGEHATAGTDINYGTSPLLLDYGVGAIIKPSTTIVASAAVYTGGTLLTTNTNGIYFSVRNDSYLSDESRNRGYFITPYIPIDEVEGMWEALVVKFKRFLYSGNRIVVKWRVLDPLFSSTTLAQNENNFEQCISAPITWVNTTSFTCVEMPSGIAVGDEVEILIGDNAGCSFKILELSATPDNAATITVTIDEAAPTASTDTAMARFDNWKTEAAISSTTVGSYRIPFTGTAHGEFIQLKIELRGIDVQVDDLIPVMKSKTSVKQS